MPNTEAEKAIANQTFLGESFQALNPDLNARTASLSLEAFICTLVGIYIPVNLGLDQAMLISLFFVSVPMSQRLSLLLEENRTRILVHEESSFLVNRVTAISLLSMFLGIFGGYVSAVIWAISADQLHQFDFALAAANVGRDSILTRNFATLGPIVLHNMAVLATLMFLCFIYRTFGALLGLIWNACVWAIVLVVMIERASHTSTLHPLVFGLGAASAVLPHLCFEGIAYIAGSLGAIFLSQATVRYDWGGPGFFRVLRACGALFLAATSLLGIAGLMESYFAPIVLGYLAG